MTDHEHDVGVVWDLNICPFPKLYDVSKTKENLHKAIRHFRLRYDITTLLLCGDLNTLSREQIRSLQLQGFKLVHCVERYPRCTSCKLKHREVQKCGLSPDLHISSYMLGEALLNHLPKTVLLITGDTGYCVALDYLAKSGKIIFLGVPMDFHHTLWKHGRIIWYLPKLLEGETYKWVKLERKRVGVNIVPWD